MAYLLVLGVFTASIVVGAVISSLIQEFMHVELMAPSRLRRAIFLSVPTAQGGITMILVLHVLHVQP